MNQKTYSNIDENTARHYVPDIQVVGDGDLFQTISKAWSEEEGWMKVTKAMEVRGVGCLIQVSSQQRNPDGSYALAEALTFMPGVKLNHETSPPTIVGAGVIR